MTTMLYMLPKYLDGKVAKPSLVRLGAENLPNLKQEQA